MTFFNISFVEWVLCIVAFYVVNRWIDYDIYQHVYGKKNTTRLQTIGTILCGILGAAVFIGLLQFICQYKLVKA